MLPRLRRALSWLPTFLVLAGLLGLGLWGATHDWKPSAMLAWLFPKPAAEKKPPEEPDGYVRLASPAAAERAGIEVDTARRQPTARVVEAHAVLAFDQTRYAQLAPRAHGTAWRVFRKAGDQIKGHVDVLALVSSPEASKARADFLTALVQHDVKERALARARAASGAIPERQLLDAQLALREAGVQLVNAQQALVNLGLPVKADDFKGLTDEEAAARVRALGLPKNLGNADDLPASLLPIVAPFDGLIIRRELVEGEATGPDKPAFVVADVRRVWVQMDVRQEDVERLAVGDVVTFESSATGQVSPEGRLTWISAEVDPRTRTVKARAELDNTDARLRPGTFGKARVYAAANGTTLAVPSAALQWDGQVRRVFVRQDAATFEPRFVLTGASVNGWTELLDPRLLLGAAMPGLGPSPLGVAGWLRAGQSVLVPVAPGARVATAGSHVLKSEMLKGRIGGED